MVCVRTSTSGGGLLVSVRPDSAAAPGMSSGSGISISHHESYPFFFFWLILFVIAPLFYNTLSRHMLYSLDKNTYRLRMLGFEPALILDD